MHWDKRVLNVDFGTSRYVYSWKIHWDVLYCWYPNDVLEPQEIKCVHPSSLLFLVKLTYTDEEILIDLNVIPQGVAGKKEDVGWAHACEDDRWYTDSTTAPHAALHPLLQLSAQRRYPHPAEDRRGARLQGLCQGNSKSANRLACHLHLFLVEISQMNYGESFILPICGKNTKCKCVSLCVTEVGHGSSL